jgi:MbtH protein
LVQINNEGEYPLWPTSIDIPAGWTIAHLQGTRQACLGYINQRWTDIRPQSIIDAMNDQQSGLGTVGLAHGHDIIPTRLNSPRSNLLDEHERLTGLLDIFPRLASSNTGRYQNRDIESVATLLASWPQPYRRGSCGARARLGATWLAGAGWVALCVAGGYFAGWLGRSAWCAAPR